MGFAILLALTGHFGEYWGEDNQSFQLKANNEIILDFDGCGFRGIYDLQIINQKLELSTSNLRPIYGEECSFVDWHDRLTGRLEDNCFMFDQIGHYCRGDL